MNITTTAPETVTNNIELCALAFVCYYPAYDKKKLAGLVKSIRLNGWVGSPLVYFDSQLLQGSHRYAAAIKAGLTAIPCVNYSDVFCVDADEVDEIVRTQEDWIVALTYLALDSDPEIAAYLGMDAHQKPLR